MAEYEVAWQVFGTKTVEAADEVAAVEQVTEWLEDDHDMDKNVADGWDYKVTGVRG